MAEIPKRLLEGLSRELSRELRELFASIPGRVEIESTLESIEERLDALFWRALEMLASAAGLEVRDPRPRVENPKERLRELAEWLRSLDSSDLDGLRAVLERFAASLGITLSPPSDGGGARPNPPTPGQPPGDGPTGPGGTSTPPNPNPPMEAPVATFTFEKRGIPSDLATTEALQKQYTDTVRQLIKLRGANGDDEVLVAAVVGGLLRSSQFTPQSSSFALFARRILDELLVSRGPSGQPLSAVATGAFTSLQVHQEIAKYLSERSDGAPISYQLFSFVGEETMRTIGNVPIGDPSFRPRIDRAVLDYASGATGFESLELPPLESTTDTEIVPENIQAVGMLYAARELEKARLLVSCDLISDLYDDGLIPIAYDDAGQALDAYRFAVDERVPEGKRASYFARIFGASGGEVAKTVQPNAQFETLLMRFMSSVAEYERERDIAQIFERSASTQGRVGLITGEHVRKAGRELAANLSLYGWGSAHTVARRLNAHIKTALHIMAMPQVQQAFGATNEWQVVERVCQQELKHIPNILKHKTMAESGKMVLDILAKHAAVWRRSGSDVFTELGSDADLLRNHARYWLTVNGITDSTLDKMSQPVESAVLPTVPAFSGTQIPSGLNGASTGVNEQALSQLRNMVASGQTPSPEQLQRLLAN